MINLFLCRIDLHITQFLKRILNSIVFQSKPPRVRENLFLYKKAKDSNPKEQKTTKKSSKKRLNDKKFEKLAIKCLLNEY